jgi:hypothetical protein
MPVDMGDQILSPMSKSNCREPTILQSWDLMWVIKDYLGRVRRVSTTWSVKKVYVDKSNHGDN